MPLSSKERDALPAEQFAVPGKRVLPIHDATHVKMAWSMVDKTKDLSDEERALAKRKIISKAKSLGLDTSKWKTNLQAASDNNSVSAPIDKDKNKKKAEEAIAAALAAMSLSFWKFYLAYIAPDKAEDLNDVYDAANYSTGRASNLIDMLNETTRQRIDAAVAKAKGKSSKEIADIVRATMAEMSSSRPSLIADTESTGAFGNSSIEANKALGFDKSRWLTMQDLKVRHTHNAMLGQTVNTGSLFTSPSGAMALHPGGFGLAEEDCGCRCYILPVYGATALSIAASGMHSDKEHFEAFEKFRQEEAAKLVPLFEALFKEQEEQILSNLKTPDVIKIEAMSLDVPITPDHPNKLPFTGILTRLDMPSDNPPSGSNGKKVVLPTAVAEKVLPTLLGMAIDYTPNLDGHEPTRKIGIIDDANIVGNAIHIGGFFYAADFPKQVARIRQDVNKLGFSWELKNIYIEDVEADPWIITDCVFTGAAVLQKEKAAYITTSLAASASGEIDMATIEELVALVTGISEKVNKLEANAENMAAAHNIPATVAVHTAKLRDAANGMEAAGIGCHAASGHVGAIRAMADSMDADAAKGITPSTWAGSGNGTIWASAATLKPVEDPVAKAEMATIKDGLAALQTTIKDMAAAASASAGAAPERKTLSPTLTNLLAKSGINAPEGENKLSVADLNKTLKESTLSIQQRMELKALLNREGVLSTT